MRPVSDCRITYRSLRALNGLYKPLPMNRDAAAVAEIVCAVLADIAPLVARDGGKIEFVSYEDGIVTVRLHGACATCPISLMTLRFGIEDRVREQVPELKAVRAII